MTWFNGRDDNGARGAVYEYGDSIGNNNSFYQQAVMGNGGLNQQAGNLASQNYMQGAQQAYGQQQNAAQMLYNQAAGVAPSAADLQMQAGIGQANNAAQSAAYSQQGGVSPGLTQRNMLNSQAAANANIVGQGSAMRAQEQQAAQGQYASILSAMQNEQQNMGNFAYQQGQNNLGYQTQNLNNVYNNNATTSANYFNARMGDFDARAKANQSAMSNVTQLASAAAGAASGGLASAAAGKAKG